MLSSISTGSLLSHLANPSYQSAAPAPAAQSAPTQAKDTVSLSSAGLKASGGGDTDGDNDGH